MQMGWRRIWRRKRAIHRGTHRGYSGQGRGLNLLFASLGIGLALLAIRAFDASVRPTLTVLAEAKVKNAVTQVVACAVNRTLTQEAIAYQDIISLQTDHAGRITALTSNSAEMNRLCTDIVSEITTQVDSLDSKELEIPLGNILGFSVVSDKGPRLSVRILSVGSVNADFHNVFTEAGINQTYHQVMLDVTVALKLLIPGGTIDTSVTTQVNVAETVIVGQVPDAYLQLGDGAK